VTILLDTNAFLWLTCAPHLLSTAAAACIQRATALYLSSISANEIAIKYRLNKLPLPDEPSLFVPRERMAHGIAVLPLNEPPALLLATLPLLHRDPFDRLLICQAIEHHLTILTPDEHIRQYKVETIW
jgi:PIN domain nuclease of toxin-antitoxin system